MTARRRGIDHAFAYGVSQAGRLIRQFLSEGLNVDETGMTVFDGVFSEFASAATGEFNHRYAQPSVAQVNGFGNMAPFAPAELLARQRQLGGVPKTIFTNSATEYWVSGGALLHVDPRTGADLPEDPDVRTYLLASTDHFGSSKLKEALPTANAAHRLDVTPVNRALFVALEEWVCDGCRTAAQQGAANQRRYGGGPQGGSVGLQPHHRPGSLGASACAEDRPRPRRRIAGSAAGRSNWVSRTSTWCRRLTTTGTRWPVSGCPPWQRRWPPTRAGIPGGTSTSCPMCLHRRSEHRCRRRSVKAVRCHRHRRSVAQLQSADTEVSVRVPGEDTDAKHGGFGIAAQVLPNAGRWSEPPRARKALIRQLSRRGADPQFAQNSSRPSISCWPHPCLC